MFPKIKSPLKEVNTPKIYPEFEFVMNFDGCSKGNPGIAGAGAVIYQNEIEILSDIFFVGEKATNNHAEYAGLILGLQMAYELDIKSLLVKGDSMLIINHMNGTYKCSSSNLIELYNRAKELESKFDNIYYQHVLRNFNKRADELSNDAIKDYKI
jgi:ribonuclease HI